MWVHGRYIIKRNRWDGFLCKGDKPYIYFDGKEFRETDDLWLAYRFSLTDKPQQPMQLELDI